VKTLLASKQIDVGVHPTFHIPILGKMDADVIASTVLALLIFAFLGFRMRSRVTDGVPGKLQLMWEIIYEMVSDLALSAIGPKGKRYIPIGVTVFVFILICNWIGFIPSALHPGSSFELLPAPTADVNLPLAFALFVIIWVHAASIRSRGIRGYFSHYSQPFKALLPINIIEEITKPITLTFRLFGNLFSGGLMILVMTTLLPIYVVPFGEIIWKPFDLFIGAIQAYIFMLLTIIYFAMSTSNDPAHNEVLETSH